MLFFSFSNSQTQYYATVSAKNTQTSLGRATRVKLEL